MIRHLLTWLGIYAGIFPFPLLLCWAAGPV